MITISCSLTRPDRGLRALALIGVEDDGKVHVEAGAAVLDLPLRPQPSVNSSHFSSSAFVLEFFVKLVSQVTIFVEVHRSPPGVDERRSLEPGDCVGGLLTGHLLRGGPVESEGIRDLGDHPGTCLSHYGH